MRAKKYRGVFMCCETEVETEQEFEDWIDADGDLVCTIGQVVEDWAYQFYDKGSYKEISFEEIEPPVVSLADWQKFWPTL